MSKKANPSIIGLFVLGAIVLGVVAILFFGSTNIFTPKEDFVIYFEESVNGLEIGAPVKFKGVPIGEVTGILISFNDQHTNAYIPVMIEIDKAKLQDRIGESVDLKSPNLLQNAIDHGL
ncbi:MAG TPA: MlaD family protein, partial [Opitutales bacterium]|nr:MlaD family protein [Opitutales bacterium]